MNSAAPAGKRRKHSGRLVFLRILTILIGLAAGLSVTEVGLRIVEKIQLGDRAKTAATVDDPQLGTRVVPYATGHDANGFRNASVPPKVDVVALGDSQTWGINVHTDDAWPQQLEKLSGHSVYNMGVGGYGPIQYWILTDKALGLSPKVIVAGLYFGNDLYDAYSMTYTLNNHAGLRRSADQLLSRKPAPSARTVTGLLGRREETTIATDAHRWQVGASGCANTPPSVVF